MKDMNELITIIGTGYIGLPTAMVIADNGYQVCGYDNNTKLIKKLKSHEIHISEDGLENLFLKVTKNGNLSFSNKILQSDVFVITVPTPIKEDGYEPELSYVFEAVKNICTVLKNGDLIILESTSPVGTTKNIYDLIHQSRPDIELPSESNENNSISIAYCPERILPGNTLSELVSNDRIVGGISKTCSKRASEFYRIFCKGNIMETNSQTAEMAKLTENSYRDVNIAFANELSIICNNLDINPYELISLANLHPRVNILDPGVGVGGHCISVDPWFIVHADKTNANLIKKAREINDSKPKWVISKIKEIIDEHKCNNPSIGFLGLSFKPNIDDFRNSPALEVFKYFEKHYKGKIFLHDHYIKEGSSLLTKSSNYKDVEDLKKESDIVFLLVPHNEYMSIQQDLKSLNWFYSFVNF